MGRPLWNGALAFGLVSIPIELHSSSVDTNVRFHLITPDGKCRVHRKLVCPETGKEIDFSDTVRGFEIAPDQYVVVTPEELQKLQPESGTTIDLDRFVEVEAIDPIYFERTYFAVPKKGATKAYWLLHQALSKSKRAGIGEFIMREKEHIAAVRAGDGVIYVDTLRFSDEVRKTSDLDLPDEPARQSEKELKLAIDLIENLSGAFKPSEYRDDYAREVRALVEKKAKGKRATAVKPKDKKPVGKVLDLMKKLEESLKTKKSPSKKTAKSSAASTTRKKRTGSRR